MNLLRDLRFAVRLLAKDPWFTIVAALTIGAGIGVNATVFTLFNAILIRGLPFEHSERLVALGTRDARGRERGLSYLDYQDWRDATRTLSGVAAFGGGNMTLGDEGRVPERYFGSFVSSSAFRALGVKPMLGRDFAADDDRPGSAVVLLSAAVWHSRYGTDPGILNRTVRVNGVPSTVIGIMPEDFKYPGNTDVWQPLAAIPNLSTQTRDQRGLNIFARLADGATLAQATAEINTIAARLAAEYPATNKDVKPTVVPLDERVNGPQIRTMFTALMGAVAFVLLIACANVANLLLARSAHRAREISLRFSLGATRWQILRQLLVESLVLAAVGGALGFAFAIVGVRLFDAAVSDPALGKPYWIKFTMDSVVVAYFAAVCLATAVAFGLVPALHVSKTNVNDALKEGGRGGTGGRRARRWTGALVIAELALTLVLLAGAGFMMRSFLTLYRFDVGVSTANLTTMRLNLPDQKYKTPSQRAQFYDALQEQLASLPGVRGVTIVSNLPLQGGTVRQLSIAGQPDRPGESLPEVLIVRAGVRYFDAFDLRLTRGRGFDALDGTPGHETAIVNDVFARTHFPNDDPVGRRIRLNDEGGTPPLEATIVGIAPYVQQRNLQSSPGPDAVVYLPYRGDPVPFTTVAARTAGDPAAVTAAIRERVRSLDGDLPVFDIQTMDQRLAISRWPYRVFGTMFALFALIALILSAVGLYAVTSYSVTQRTQEIGIRMALGAETKQVVWLFLRQAIVKLAIGLSIGLAGAVGVGAVLQTFLIGMSSHDPVTLASIAVMLAVVSAAASYWPTRRATRVDPVHALRYE